METCEYGQILCGRGVTAPTGTAGGNEGPGPTQPPQTETKVRRGPGGETGAKRSGEPFERGRVQAHRRGCEWWIANADGEAEAEVRRTKIHEPSGEASVASKMLSKKNQPPRHTKRREESRRLPNVRSKMSHSRTIVTAIISDCDRPRDRDRERRLR